MILKASYAASGMTVAMIVLALAGIAVVFSAFQGEWYGAVNGLSLAVLGLILGIVSEIGVNLADSHNSKLPPESTKSEG